MSAHMSACIPTHMSAHISTLMSAHMPPRIYTGVCPNMSVDMCLEIGVTCVLTCMPTCVPTCVLACVLRLCRDMWLLWVTNIPVWKKKERRLFPEKKLDVALKSTCKMRHMTKVHMPVSDRRLGCTGLHLYIYVVFYHCWLVLGRYIITAACMPISKRTSSWLECP